MESRHACGPIRQAGEMTAAAAWLLSDDAAFCCGTELLMDGGYSYWSPRCRR
jgi:hypothetical protein